MEPPQIEIVENVKSDKSHVMNHLLTIGTTPVMIDSQGVVQFIAGATIDADGSPHAYHPQSGKGLDFIGNARSKSGWCGIILHFGKPVVQGPNDPAPGYYVSPTTYEHEQFKRYDPRRYVNSETVPFIAVSPAVIQSVIPVVIGSKCEITWHGKTIEAVVADVGPRKKCGEISIAAARLLGIPASPKTGGVEDGVTYRIFPGVPAELDGVKYVLKPWKKHE